MNTCYKSTIPSAPDNKSGWPWEDNKPLSSNLSKIKLSSLPVISVITPNLNSGRFLEQAIRSVLFQKYPFVEHIVIDGGSTDNSLKIIRKYEKCLSYWVSEPDRGQSHALNKALKKATGEIVFWLNADDICMPNAFYSSINAFSCYSGSSLITGQAYEIDETGKIIGRQNSCFTDWEDYATLRYSLRQVSTFYRKSAIIEMGMIDESLHYSMDRDLHLRITKKHKPVVIKNYLSAFRLHDNNKFNSSIVKGYAESDRVTKKYIHNDSLLKSFKKNRSIFWVKLAGPQKKICLKIECIFRCFILMPFILFKLSFWREISSYFQRQIIRVYTPKN